MTDQSDQHAPGVHPTRGLDEPTPAASAEPAQSDDEATHTRVRPAAVMPPVTEPRRAESAPLPPAAMPPAHQPPAATPPAQQPPAATPPAQLPPAATPPVDLQPVASQYQPQPTGPQQPTGHQQPTGPKEIATLPPIDELTPQIPISEATGQPPRDKVMLVGMSMLYLSAAIATVAFGWMWWQSIHIETYLGSARLLGWLDQRPGSWQSIALAIATAAISLITVAAPAVSGFQAWNGHKWSRIAAAVAAVLSLLGILLNTVALVAIPFAVIGAAILWLPQVSTYFGHWAAFRAPQHKNPIDVSKVVYGPLPRYR